MKKKKKPGYRTSAQGQQMARVWARANPPPHPPLLHVFGVFYDGDETTKKERPATSRPRRFFKLLRDYSNSLHMSNSTKLKGLGYAISYLFFFKKGKNFFRIYSQNNDPVLLLKTMVWHWRCFLSSVVTDGKDWNLKTFAQRFQVLILCLLKSPKCLKFVWYLIFNSTVAFYVWVKELMGTK